MAKAAQIKLRLFIEGIECPVISAQVTAQPNSPAQCSIQVPPTSLATKLLPRTTVHLFFADPYEDEHPLVAFRGDDAARKRKDPTMYERSKQRFVDAKDSGGIKPEDIAAFLGDVRNVQYKLLFGGEIHGVQWTKEANNRSVVFQCVDFSNYWDYAYQFNNTDLFGPGLKAVFSGGSTNLLTDFLSTPGEIVMGILHQKSVNYPALKGLLGGIVRMLEAIGGSYFTEDNKFAGQNIFYSLAELRLHITQMITVFPDDDTSAKLLSVGGWSGLFGRTLGNLGEQVSIRKVLNALMGLMFHETYSVPCPYFSPGLEGTIAGRVTKRLRDVPDLFPLFAAAYLGRQTIEDVKQTINDPQISSAVLGAVTDAQFQKVVDSEQLPKQKNALLLRLSLTKKFCNSNAKLASKKRKGAASPAMGAVSSAFSSAATLIGKAVTGLQKSWFVTTPPTNPKIKAILALLDLADAQLKRVIEQEVNQTPKSKQIPARLNNQVFKPDIWFGAPPRCNVIFPDHYTSIQYSRSFMAEPTRLMLKTSNEFFGEDELFDNFYVSPVTKSLKGKGGKNNLGLLFNSDIMSHELFTGILPVFEKMGEMNIFAVRSGTVKGKNPKVGLAERSANFMYFKRRFAARQMTLSTRFNPFIAPGFPCLVIDKYVDQAQIQSYQAQLSKAGRSNPLIDSLLGTHFMGSAVQVAHFIGQREQRTEMQLAFPREFNEITEFFGPDIQEKQEVQKRFGDDALRETKVAALSPPSIGAIGPNFGIISRVKDITAEIGSTDAQIAQLYPLYAGPRRAGTGEVNTFVPVGLEVAAGTLGAVVVDLVGSANRKVKFNGYSVLEEVPQYRREIIDLPAEELIRPGWYGDAWHPFKIGKAYDYFLGTGSITDETFAFTSTTGNSTADADVAILGGDDASNVDLSKIQVVSTLDMQSNTEQAVRFLLLSYSYAKQAGVDVDAFIRAYTWRPIATMVDIFGTSDLQYDKEGHEVVQGVEGFHSKAFGPYNDLFGLVPPEITEILGIKKVSIARQQGDVRGRRFEAARNFIDQLSFSKALLG